MAKKEKGPVGTSTNIEDFSSDLIKSLNTEFGTKVAYNLGTMDSPTHVKWWISTGSKLLDYVIANKQEGGVPSGRIIEISGMPSTGKSHIAFQIARTVQKMGGLVVYIDTENATPVEKLANMGIDVTKKFVYCDTHCTEEVFSIIESTITKAAELVKKEVPILVVWDSVAATSPKAELEGDYDQNTMGLQARVISKGMRKITGVIGQNNVTLICCNQVRQKMGVIMGDPTTTPGGLSIPFHASVRLSLTGGSALKDKDGNVIGTNVYLKSIKNKVAPPHRKIEFSILFGRGIYENDSIFEMIAERSKGLGVPLKDNKYLSITGAAWRTIKIATVDGEILKEKKFQKIGWEDVMADPEWKDDIIEAIDSMMVVNNGDAFIATDEEERDEPNDDN